MAHRPPRIDIPDYDSLHRQESKPPRVSDGWAPAVLPIQGDTRNMHVDGMMYVQRGGRELCISNGGNEQLDFVFENSVFRCSPDNDLTAWLDRRYKCRGITRHMRFENCPMEHAQYLCPFDGVLRFESNLYRRIAAQWIQLRLATSDNSGQPENSPLYNLERRIEVVGNVALECGMKRGGGRASYGLSIFAMGPNTDVLIDGNFIQTVQQHDVDGKGHDSQGGILVETCRKLVITNSTVELKNPAKSDVQLYEYDTQPSQTHHRTPQESIEIGGCIFEGNVDIRVEETPDIRVSGCQGNGRLRLWKGNVNTDKWEIVRNMPISQGYSQGNWS